MEWHKREAVSAIKRRFEAKLKEYRGGNPTIRNEARLDAIQEALTELLIELEGE